MSRSQYNRYGRRVRFEEEPPASRGRRHVLPERHSSPVGQRLTAAACTLALIAFLFSYGFWTVSGAGPAERILARTIPTLTEVDRLLALHEQEMQAQARAATSTPLTLPGFPFAVALTPREVLSLSTERQQTLLEQRAARLIYARGSAAFSVTGGQNRQQAGGVLSPTWTMREMLRLLNARTHARFASLSLLLGTAGVLIGLGFCLQVGSYGRLVGLAAAGVCGALIAGLAALFVWLVIQIYSAGASSPLALAAWGMTSDVTWTLVLIDAVALLTSICVLCVGLGFAALGRDPRPARGAGQVRMRVQSPRRRPLDPSKFD